MAIVDVIKWDAAPSVLAWKYPSEELGTWSQLIVAESQEAVLVKEGQFVGPFSAGRHVLDTKNYPILRDLFKIPFGRSPFTAEVWFIQKTFNLEVLWGTSDPLLMEDPRFHIMIPVRAFGQYGLQVEDSRMFLKKLVGTLPAFTVNTLTKHFKGIILSLAKSTIAEYFIKKEVSLLQIAMYLEELSNALQEALSARLAMYGVKLVNFSVNSINTDEQDPGVVRLRDAMAERAEMNIVGYSYQQKRSFDVMETAAGNEGAGSAQASLMGAGIGMGMGIGMGQNMGNQMTQIGTGMNVGSKVCTQCGTPLAPNAKFCGNCGHPVPAPNPLTCPKCNAPVQPNAKFCGNCGQALQ